MLESATSVVFQEERQLQGHFLLQSDPKVSLELWNMYYFIKTLLESTRITSVTKSNWRKSMKTLSGTKNGDKNFKIL